MAAVRDARAVPVPVKVPAPLITAAATGSKMALAPLMLKVPPTEKLRLLVNGCVVFESVKLLKVRTDVPSAPELHVGVPLQIFWEPLPEKMKVLVLPFGPVPSRPT